jgi:hypothetical protein
MRPSLRLLLLSATASLATGCEGPLFFAEAELEEVCKTEQRVTFPAAFPGIASIQQAFELPIGDTGASLPEGEMETELQLKVFEVTVTSGNADLGRIETASVTLRPTGSTTPVKLVDYQRPANTGTLTTLSLRASAPVDVLELARQETLELTFEARGQLPQQQWTASLRACASLRAKVDYFDIAF